MEQSNSGSWTTDYTWTYTWDQENRLLSVNKCVGENGSYDFIVEYSYCPTCSGALSERIEKDGIAREPSPPEAGKSWLRYEYEGLNFTRHDVQGGLLRIDGVFDYDDDGTLEDPANGDDPWHPINTFVHGPGVIGNVVRASWYRYTWDNSDTPCETGSWVPAYDALGNQVGVVTNQNEGEFYRWETDAYGNSLYGTDVFTNPFLGFDQEGPKEHLTGKMFDTDTGYFYFHARWYDPGVGRFVIHGVLTNCA